MDEEENVIDATIMSVKISIDLMSFAYQRTAPLFDAITASIIPVAPSGGRGFVTVVMGSSGCGKTTLLKLLLGEERPSAGGISIEPPEPRISYLSQDPVLFEHLSVVKNARYFAYLKSTRPDFDEHLFQQAAQELGLSNVLKESSTITELSGGERQRIALLRAISIRPALLLLDEPCRGLDIPIRQEFLFYLRRIVDELGLAVIYVTHQQSEARLLADRVLFLIRSETTGISRIVEGTLDELIAHPRHELIALTFADGPVNRVPAELVGNRLFLFGKAYHLEKSDRGGLSTDGQVSVLFEASQTRWNSQSGIPCRVQAVTGEFLLASIEDGSATGSILVGPFTDEKINNCYVHGQVFAFGHDGELIVDGTVMEEAVSARFVPSSVSDT